MTAITDLIAKCNERREFDMLEDGYYYYWPSNQGAIAPWELRAIADELDRLNADWDKQVQEALGKVNERDN